MRGVRDAHPSRCFQPLHRIEKLHAWFPHWPLISIWRYSDVRLTYNPTYVQIDLHVRTNTIPTYVGLPFRRTSDFFSMPLHDTFHEVA